MGRGALSTIGLALAGYALVRFGKRLFDQPRDDLSDGFGLDNYIPSRASSPFARMPVPAAVPHLGGRDSFFHGIVEDDGFTTVWPGFDDTFHTDAFSTEAQQDDA